MRPASWFRELLREGVEKITTEVADIGTADVDEVDADSVDADEGTFTTASADTLGWGELDDDTAVLSPPDNSEDLDAEFDEWIDTGESTASVLLEASTQTDGEEMAEIAVEVDEGSTDETDYTITLSFAPSWIEPETPEYGSIQLSLPPESQLRIVNDSDPVDANEITTARQLSL